MAYTISPISDVRRNLAALIEELREKRSAVLITQYSRPTAVLLNYEDYVELMERLEDLQDLRDMEAAEAEWRAAGQGTSLDALKSQLS